MKLKHIFSIGLLSSTFLLSAQTNQEILKLIDQEVKANSEAYALLKSATETIGHRMTGTENGKKAEELAASILKQYGYEVEFQDFKFKGWERENLDLSIDGVPLKAVALAHSPAEVKLSGELIYLGNGLESDYQKLGDKVKGKVVFAALGLVEGTGKEVKNLHRSEKTALAKKYGAKGIILYNQAKNGILLTGTASVTGDIIDIPAINIAYEDGMKWSEVLKSKSLSVDISMNNKIEEVTARNVIARLKGSDLSKEKIVLGGHLDSWDLATGAIDNGVGSFSILDIARTYKKLNLKNKRTIEFVLFMGEEIGLLGSKHYVKEVINNGSIKEIVAMSNMDMTINPKAYVATMDSGLTVLDDIARDVKKYIPDFNLKSTKKLGLHSDHQPFMLQGVPIIGLDQSQFAPGALDCYHADCDEIKYVEEKGLKNNVLLETYLLYRLSNEEKLPMQTWDEKEIEENLKSANLETPLRISGEWRW